MLILRNTSIDLNIKKQRLSVNVDEKDARDTLQNANQLYSAGGVRRTNPSPTASEVSRATGWERFLQLITVMKYYSGKILGRVAQAPLRVSVLMLIKFLGKYDMAQGAYVQIHCIIFTYLFFLVPIASKAMHVGSSEFVGTTYRDVAGIFGHIQVHGST